MVTLRGNNQPIATTAHITMATSTHPATIGLLEYRYITSNGLPLICFLTYKEGTQEKLHLVHALACGTDIMEILNATTVEQIEAEALANMGSGHGIAVFVQMPKAHELRQENHGLRSGGWLA